MSRFIPHAVRGQGAGAGMIKRIFGYARPYIGPLAAVNILSPLSSLVFVSYFIILKSLIDGGIVAKDIGVIKRDLAVLVALAFLREAFNYISGWTRNVVQEKMHKDVQMDIFSRILRFPLATHARLHAGGLINKVIDESGSIPLLLSQLTVEAIQEPVRIIGLSAVLFYFDPALAFIIVAIVIPFVLVNRFIAHRLDRVYNAYYEKKADVLTRLAEVISAIPVVKAFVRERDEERRFDGLLDALLRTDLRLGKVALFASPVNELTKIISLSVIVLAGSYHVKAGSMNAGTLVLFIGTAMSLFASLSGLSFLYTAFRNNMVAAKRVCGLMSLSDEDAEDGSGAEMPGGLRGTVSLRDVSFGYPGRPAVFEGLSLDIGGGDMIAVIGESGSGKTTLAGILARLYRPQEGRLLLSGRDAAEYRVSDWRKRIGIVFQDTVIFSGTVYDNIAYARPGARPDEVCAAARAADLHDFIVSLKDGYGTSVGERGAGLSGGQGQRVAIARALLIDPDLLILDEATSFVDVESEERILSAVKALRRDKKTLMMTHRESSLKFADKVYKLYKGKLEKMEKERNVTL